MRFSIEPILHVVSKVSGPNNSAPCHLKPLLSLISHVLGETQGPSMVPGFLIECVTTGLVVVQQHPKLTQVRFKSTIHGEADYQAWLRSQRSRLGLPEQLDITRPKASELGNARRQAGPIVQRILRHIASSR